MSNSNLLQVNRNSLLLIVRLVLVTLFNFLFVKYAIQFVGYEQYGYFTSVVSIILTLQLVNSILVSVSNRYLSYALGNEDINTVRAEFTSSFKLHLLLAAITFVIGLGLYPFLIAGLDLATDATKFLAVQFLYFGALFVSFLTIVSTPYQALLIAYENFKTKVIIEVINAFLKLMSIALMLLLSYEEFITLSYSFPILTLIAPIIFIIYTSAKYRQVCTLSKTVSCRSIRGKVNFGVWSALGGITQLLKTQILVVLFINIYEPTASSIASVINQIYFAAWSLILIYSQATHPKIIKLYSQNQSEEITKLIRTVCSVSLMVATLVFSGFFLLKQEVLLLWLGEGFPQEIMVGAVFIILALVGESIILPIHSLVAARGDIRNYQLKLWIPLVVIFTVTVSFGSQIPLTYYYIGIFANSIICCVISIYHLKHQFKIKPLQYISFDKIQLVFFLVCLLSVVASFQYGEQFGLKLALPSALILCGLFAINVKRLVY